MKGYFMKLNKQHITEKKEQVVTDIKNFESFVKKIYTSDSLLSRQQLHKLNQTSQIMLRPLQSQLDDKLPTQSFNLSLIRYKNDLRVRQLQVVLPTGEVTNIQKFLKQLNLLLLGKILESDFYQNIKLTVVSNVQIETADKIKRANQSLKQRIRQLTDAKIQLMEQYDCTQVKLAQQAKQLIIREKQNEKLQTKIKQLEQTILDCRFEFEKQKTEMSTLREQIRIKQTKQNRQKVVKQISNIKHVCPKLDDKSFKEEIASLKQKFSEVQAELRLYKKRSHPDAPISRSERIRQLTSELNFACVEDYHPLLRLVHKYNDLVAEDLTLWQQIQGHFEKIDECWRFIDQNGQVYALSDISLNGITQDSLTTNYYYSARQRSDTGYVMMIRQLNKRVIDQQPTQEETETISPILSLKKQVLIISWWGETVKNATKKLNHLGIDVVWLDPSDVSNDKIMHEMQKTQYDFVLIVMRGAHHETVTAAHRLRRSGRQIKVANNPGASAMFDYVSGALGLADEC